jgi:hypothetical protein
MISAAVDVENAAVYARDRDTDDVGVDQPADPGLPQLKVAIQAAVLQRHRGLRREHLQHRNPRGRKHTGRQMVFQVEQGYSSRFHEEQDISDLRSARRLVKGAVSGRASGRSMRSCREAP